MIKNEIDRSCVRSIVDHKTINTLRYELAEMHELTPHAEIIALLSNRTRLEILYCLSKADELCVCDLADIINKEISSISHQLRKLKDLRMLKRRREGTIIYYRLAPSPEIAEALQTVSLIFSSHIPSELAYSV